MEIKRQFRDVYEFVPNGGSDADPHFNKIPDGVYPMTINDRVDYVEIRDMQISCCNFKADDSTN